LIFHIGNPIAGDPLHLHIPLGLTTGPRL